MMPNTYHFSAKGVRKNYQKDTKGTTLNSSGNQ